MAVFTAKSQTAIAPVAGDGTSGNPYQIATLDNLYWLSQSDTAWDKNYIQTANINAAETHNWNISGTDTLGFSPIGNNTIKFTGTYNGKEHIIDSLFINRPNSNNVGLFGYANYSEIDSVGVLNVNLTGKGFSGALIGYSYHSNVNTCYSTGNVVGGEAYGGIGYSGGLIGRIELSTIYNCYSSVDIYSDFDYIGGFSGFNYQSTIYNCYSTGNVIGGNYVGGFIGTNSGNNAIIYTSYSTGDVGGAYIAGFCALNKYDAVIHDCYCNGEVTSIASDYSGGFVAMQSQDSPSIYNCYSTSVVHSALGFIGNLSDGTVSNSFWDTEVSGQASSAGGTGKTTAEMQTLTTYTDSTWDFVGETANGTNDYWDMNACLSAYPTLSWQVFETPIGSGTTVDPYQIATLADLRWLSENSCVWDKHFIQTADINAAETHNWNISGSDTLGFSPIGNITIRFTGTYNGQGHIIDSLFIDRPSSDNLALIGMMNSSIVENVGLINVNITGNNNIAGIVGENWFSALISNCFCTGNINGNMCVGGIAGINYLGTISNSYSSVNINGFKYVGGVTGRNFTNANVNNCYSVGLVVGTSYVGGLIGGNTTSTTTNSFWDTETSGQATSAGGTGLTTAEMQTLTTYTDSTWDFVGETANGTNDYWDMSVCLNGGYPYLSWQTNLSFTTPAGSGTTAEPYQIATLADLRWLSENSCVWDKNFIQTADINATETHNWNISGSDTLGFSPIGNLTSEFAGTYNGQGHIIDSLFINRPTESFIGLFGYIEYTEIDSLGMTNANILGFGRVGMLVGLGNNYSTINACYTSGNVESDYNYVGGIIGRSLATIVKNSYSSGNVIGNNYAGGITCETAANSTIENCYSNCEVNANLTNVGGLIGELNTGTITNSFYNTDSTATSAGGTGLTTAEMQQMCVYADSTWDFMLETVNGTNDIWGLNANENGGYPFLSWQAYAHTESCCGYVDLENPVLSTQNTTIYLDATGNATLIADSVIISASDNCTISDTTLSQELFT